MQGRKRDRQDDRGGGKGGRAQKRKRGKIEAPKERAHPWKQHSRGSFAVNEGLNRGESEAAHLRDGRMTIASEAWEQSQWRVDQVAEGAKPRRTASHSHLPLPPLPRESQYDLLVSNWAARFSSWD